MNTRSHPVAAGLDSPAQRRLAQSRAGIDHWLAREAPAAPSVLGCAVRGALPLLDGLRTHPAAALVVGTLAKAWLRSGRPAPAPDHGLHPLGAAVALVRRHPGATLAVAGLACVAWFVAGRPPGGRAPP